MYELYTDGSVFFEKKAGGWAFLLKMNAATIKENGFVKGKDINRLELLAVVNGLEAIGGQGVEVTVFTDSLYVIGAGNKTLRNKHIGPLITRLIELKQKHQVSFVQLIPGERPLEHYEVHRLAREAALNDLQRHRHNTNQICLS